LSFLDSIERPLILEPVSWGPIIHAANFKPCPSKIDCHLSQQTTLILILWV
jgi:hypothetical protein